MRINIRHDTEDNSDNSCNADRYQHRVADIAIFTELLLRILAEVCHLYNRHQIAGSQKRTGNPDENVQRLACLQSAECQIPFADKANEEWRTGDTQRSNREAGHCYRQLLAYAIQLTDIVSVCTRDNQTGAHKEGNLHNSMSHKVQVGTLDAQRRNPRST